MQKLLNRDRDAVLHEDSGGLKEPFIRRGCRSRRGRGNFRKLSGPFKSIVNLRCSVAAAFAAKGIIQSPITSRSRRDHSVCQASASSILKISGRRRCALGREGGGGIATARAKSDIYNRLV